MRKFAINGISQAVHIKCAGDIFPWRTDMTSYKQSSLATESKDKMASLEIRRQTIDVTTPPNNRSYKLSLFISALYDVFVTYYVTFCRMYRL